MKFIDSLIYAYNSMAKKTEEGVEDLHLPDLTEEKLKGIIDRVFEALKRCNCDSNKAILSMREDFMKSIARREDETANQKESDCPS